MISLLCLFYLSVNRLSKEGPHTCNLRGTSCGTSCGTCGTREGFPGVFLGAGGTLCEISSGTSLSNIWRKEPPPP